MSTEESSTAAWAEEAEQAETADRRRMLASSAVMAAGTVVSRLSGFVRGALIVAALGGVLRADLYSLANTVPNMVYILVAGGIFNAVLVPQLVRAMKADADGGEAYANRVITLAALFLGVVSVLLVVAAPWVMSVVLDDSFDAARLAEHRESAVALARWCLPQVFFYGMFALVGQVLNARGRFGPMMWAPIANNLVAIAMLVTYLVVYGSPDRGELTAPLTSSQEALLGLGSTLGIVVQLAVLVPFLRAAGFRYRPRFDFRDAGLGHTLRLGLWTVLFVLVNQAAYVVVVNLASGGTASGSVEGTGYTVYSQSFLIMMVPHAIVTVSLATAALPRLSGYAAEHDLAPMGRLLGSTLRTSLAVVVPVAAVLPVVALDAVTAVFGFGGGGETAANFAPTLALFAPALLFFTVHYLMLRGFYALERTRSVFWVQCVIAAVNVVVAIVLAGRADPAQTAPALVLAYLSAYAVGSAISYLWLRRILGGLDSGLLVRTIVRCVVAAAAAAGAAALVTWALADVTLGPAQLVSALRCALAGLGAVACYLGAARALRIEEVTAVTSLLTSRLRR